MRHHTLSAAIFCACLTLAACGADKTATTQQQTSDESLPQPDAAGGSVTGMPNPGTPSVLPPPADGLATDNEDPAKESVDLATENTSTVDSNLPVGPSTITVDGDIGKPPANTMPVMPAHPPQPPGASEQSQVAPLPPKS
jgi:hypothetical protein